MCITEKNFPMFSVKKSDIFILLHLSTTSGPQESNSMFFQRKGIPDLWIAVQNIWNFRKISQMLCTVIHRHNDERKTAVRWQKLHKSGTMDSLRKGVPAMAIKYTEEQLNSVDKSMLIQMFLNQQEQLEKVSADSFLIIKQIQAIYREEGKLKELSSKERLVQRQVVVKPLVDALFVYLKQHENEVGTEKLREAFIYVLNQEKYLRVFLTDGDVPMDNNASERAIRGFCVGKKNWQMIDTINGAKSSAIIYSIAETAKANNLKPYEYFEYLLTEIPKHMDDTDRSFLNDLVPWSEKLPENIRKPKN